MKKPDKLIVLIKTWQHDLDVTEWSTFKPANVNFVEKYKQIAVKRYNNMELDQNEELRLEINRILEDLERKVVADLDTFIKTPDQYYRVSISKKFEKDSMAILSYCCIILIALGYKNVYKSSNGSIHLGGSELYS